MGLGVGIIGCGLIGNKRALSLNKHSKLIGCYDVDDNKSTLLSKKYNIKKFTSLDEIISDENIDAIIICTLHDSLSPIAIECLQHNKHILIEKPCGRNKKEVQSIVDASQKNLVIKVGFNHRFHPSFLRTNQIIGNNELGDLMFIRARYGHGGRLGYDEEWRANKELSGGGELLDQGPHLIDLCRQYLGDFKYVDGYADTLFWNMSVDDNAFMTLRTEDNKYAFLHVSCTEWKNLFSFEIYGKKGKIDIFGLGGSYGTEKITYYKMLPEMGPPETYSWEFPRADASWNEEFNSFYNDIITKNYSNESLIDALEVHDIINRIYINKK